MLRRIFYSWQSDLPNSTNRGFIQRALEEAVKKLRSDGTIDVEPVVDRDTEGVAGSPDIALTIFDKIGQAHVFVCDVSIVNQAESPARPTPNPNVLIELGYAVGVLGWGRVILVANKTTGGPEQLPFDLRPKRTITYAATEDQDTRAAERKRLARLLEQAIRSILTEIDKQEVDVLTLQAAGEVVRADTREWSQGDIHHSWISEDEVITQGLKKGLTEEQVTDGLEILAGKGVFRAEELSGGTWYFFTPVGFSQYALKNVEGYGQTLDDVTIAVTKEILNNREIAAHLNKPVVLIDHILDLFEWQGWVQLTKSTGDGEGWHTDITRVSADLRRIARNIEVPNIKSPQ